MHCDDVQYYSTVVVETRVHRPVRNDYDSKDIATRRIGQPTYHFHGRYCGSTRSRKHDRDLEEKRLRCLLRFIIPTAVADDNVV